MIITICFWVITAMLWAMVFLNRATRKLDRQITELKDRRIRCLELSVKLHGVKADVTLAKLDAYEGRRSFDEANKEIRVLRARGARLMAELEKA